MRISWNEAGVFLQIVFLLHITLFYYLPVTDDGLYEEDICLYKLIFIKHGCIGNTVKPAEFFC
jgi:hypothetical protein